MKKLINLTPHELKIHSENGNVVAVPPSGNIVRKSVKYIYSHAELTDLGEVDIFVPEYGMLLGVPIPLDDERNAILIVSSMCLEDCKEKYSSFQWASPGELIRDEAGNPVGCRGLKF